MTKWRTPWLGIAPIVLLLCVSLVLCAGTGAAGGFFPAAGLVFAGLAGGLLAGVLATLYAVRRTARSIRALKEGAERISRGELDYRLEVPAADEFAGVAAAFNQMLDRRREAYFELRESAAEYRALVEHTPAITYTETVSGSGTVSYVSPQVERILGFTVEEMDETDPFWGLLHPEDRERVVAEDERANATGGPFLAEYRLFHKEGRVVWVRDESVLVSREEDGTQHWQGVLYDITERREAEERLKTSEAELQALISAMEGVILVFDADGRYERIVSTDDSMLYIPAESRIGKTVHEVLPAETADLFARTIRSSLRTGETTHAEYALEMNGDERWFSAAVSPLWNCKVVWVARDTTDEKLAGDELRRQEEWFRSLVQNSSDAITVVTADGTITYQSSSVDNILGRRSEMDLGLNIFEAYEFHPDDLDAVQDAFAGLVSTPGGNTTVEVRVRHTDGTWRVLHAIGTNLVEDPTVRGVVANYRDVTERRQAEEQFRGAFEDTAVGMALNTFDGRFLQVNRAMCEMLGFSEAELTRMTFRDITYPEDLDESAERVRSLRDGEVGSYSVEKRFVRSDGVPIWTQLSVSALNDAEGRPLRMIAQVQDITGRKQAESRLAGSEERYRLVARATNEAIWDSDMATDRQVWNGAVEEMFGFPARQVTDTAWWEEHVHPDDRERVNASIEAILEGGGDSWTEEYRFMRGDGSYATVVDRAWVVRGEDGAPVRVVGSMMDVTERRQAEESLARNEEIYRRQAQELALLDEVRSSLARELDRLSIYRTVVEAVSDTFGYALVSYYTVEDGHLMLQHQVGYPQVLNRIPVEKGVMGRVARTGAPVLIEDGHADPAFMTAFDGIVSEVCVPIFDEDVVVGVLNLESVGGVRLGERDLLLMNALSEQVSIAVSRSRLYEETRESERRLRASEAELRTLFEAMTDVIMVIGGDGRYLSIAPTNPSLLYRPSEEMLGKTLHEVIPREQADLLLGSVRRAIETGEKVELDYGLEIGGEGLWFSAVCSPMLDDSVLIVARDVTDKKDAEEKLRAETARLQAISEGAAMGIALVEASSGGRIVESNPALRGMLGYTEQELQSMSFADFTYPDDLSKNTSLFDELVAGERDSYQMEKRYVRKNREILWGRLNVSLVRAEEGEPRYIVGMVEDVTWRKRAEEALEEAEKRYRTLVERMPAVTYLQEIGSPDSALYMSPQMEELTGFTPEEFRDPDLRFNMVHPEDREWMRSEADREYEPGETVVNEYRVLHRDGRTVWTRNESVMIEDETTGTRYWQGFMVDITDRKEAEGRLREAEERYRTLVEQMPAAIYALEPQPGSPNTYDVTYMSPQVENLLGHPPERFTDDPDFWDAQVHPEDLPTVEAEDQRTDETGEPFSLEYRMIHRDGHVVWVKEEAVLLKDGEQGERLHWQGVLYDITDRKQAEGRLQEAEQRYRQLVERIPTAIYIQAPYSEGSTSYEMEYISPQVEKILGYPPQRFTGDPTFWDSTIHAEDIGRYDAEIRRTDETGETFTMEYRMLASDGRYRWVRDDAVLIRDEGGLPLHWQGVLSDVTNRRAAEEALRESEERFRSLIQNASDIITILEADGTVRYESPAAERVLGYDPDELSGRNAFDYVHPEDLEQLYARFAEMLENPEVKPTVEFRFRHKDGSWRHLEVIGNNLLDDPSINGIVINSRDVTERARAEEALREAENRYRTLVEHMPAVTYTELMDEDSPLVYVSPQIEAMLGYTVEEWLTGSDVWVSALHPDDRDRVEDLHLSSNETGEPFAAEYRAVARDGRLVWVRDEAVLVRDREGQPLYWQGVMLDITGRKQAEMDLAAEREFLSATLDSLKDGIVACDAAGTPTLFNRAMRELYGFAQDEIDAENWNDRYALYEADGRTPVAGEKVPLLRAFKGENVRDVETVVVPDAGPARTLLSSGQAFYDGQGNKLGAVIAAHDITERRQAEDALRRNEKRFRQLFDQSVDALLVHDGRGKLVDCNEEACRSLGYDRDELLALSIKDIVATGMLTDEEKAAGTEPTLWERAISGEPGRISGTHIGEHRRKDGTTFPVEVSVGSVDYDERRMIFAACRDVTERKQAEERRRRSEARYGAILETAPHAIITMSKDGIIQSFNRGAQSIFGYDTDEVIGRPLTMLMPERFRSSHEAGFRRYIETGEARVIGKGTVELAGLRKTGEEFPLELSLGKLQEGDYVLFTGIISDITERKQAESEIRQLNESLERRVEDRTRQLEGAYDALVTREKALKESEERYRSLFVDNPDAVYSLDLDGRFVSANPAVEKISGRRSEDLAGAVAGDLLFTDEKMALMFAKHFARAREGEPQTFEATLVRGDGRRVDLSITNSPMVVAEEIVGVYGIAKDVTQRKRAEAEIKDLNESLERRVEERTEQLKQAEERLLTVVSNVPVILFALDAEGVFTLLEGQGLSALDLGPGELVGESIFEVYRDVPAIPESARRTLSGEVVSETMEMDGLTLESFFSPLMGEDGEIVGVIGVARDVTERRRAESALRESEERFRTLTDAAQDGVLIISDGVILEGNRAYAEIFGYDLPEIVGRSVLDFIAPESVEAVRRNVAGGGEEPYEVVGRRKDGVRIFAEIKDTVSTYRGEPVRMTSVRDITQRKESEVELREARENAEAANRAKSLFLANMSHEIRTPMNGVIGMTELLLGTELTGEQRDYAETVRTSGESLLHIINDILDFSKVEAGAVVLEDIDFDLKAEVEETVFLLAERARNKGLYLRGVVEPDVYTAVRGDPFRLRQVLINLVGNAIKFTEYGEVGVHVDASEETDDELVARFAVTDTGIGINPEQRDRLFRSFSQADDSTTRRYGGTGLGLAICKQLVELMGGGIRVESEPGRGSTFLFTVRLKKRARSPRDATARRGSLRGLRVLILVPDEASRSVLYEQTSSWGMRAAAAADAAEGFGMLHAAAAEPGEGFDVVVLDERLPGTDGMDLARRIKGSPELASARLVMLTQAERRDEGEQARSAGVSAYLTGPVGQSDLYDCLVSVMRGRPDATAGEAGDTPLVTRHSLREETPRSRARLLVAEDNPVNQQVAVGMLRRLGYRVDVAGDGREALRALERVPYAAVLMDCQMPEMDGYEATAEIRKREQARADESPGADAFDRLPVIAMTANALQGDREEALAAGMDDYVAKPVKPEDLQKVLERWIPADAGAIGQDERVAADVKSGASGAGRRGGNALVGPPLDPEVLASLRELGDAELLAELVELFLDDTDPRLTSLHEALDAEDAGEVERAAHTLKGSAGNMGAWRMSEIASDLQNAGRDGDLSGGAALLERLEEEYGRVRPALEKLAAEGEG